MEYFSKNGKRVLEQKSKQQLEKENRELKLKIDKRKSEIQTAKNKIRELEAKIMRLNKDIDNAKNINTNSNRRSGNPLFSNNDGIGGEQMDFFNNFFNDNSFGNNFDIPLRRPIMNNNPRTNNRRVNQNRGGIIGAEDFGDYVPEDMFPFQEEEFPQSNLEQQIINQLCPNPDNMSYEELLKLEEDVGSVSKGLSQMDIRKIPIVRYEKSKFKDNDKCVICQDDFKANERVSMLKCEHIYHPNCIKEWLKSNKKCPFCMQEIKI